MPLTVKQLEAAKFGQVQERLSDGNGLYLRLYPSGKKAFQVQVSTHAARRQRVWVSLGDFPELGLKQARETATWVRMQVGRGGLRIRFAPPSEAITVTRRRHPPKSVLVPRHPSAMSRSSGSSSSAAG